MTPEFRHCDSCGSDHLGPVPCGMSFAQRMKSTNTDFGSFETVYNRRNYYDSAAVDATFSHDSKDRLYDETDGIGYVKQADDGEWYHRDRKTNEVVKMDEKTLDTILAAETETDVA